MHSAHDKLGGARTGTSDESRLDDIEFNTVYTGSGIWKTYVIRDEVYIQGYASHDPQDSLMRAINSVKSGELSVVSVSRNNANL